MMMWEYSHFLCVTNIKLYRWYNKKFEGEIKGFQMERFIKIKKRGSRTEGHYNLMLINEK